MRPLRRPTRIASRTAGSSSSAINSLAAAGRARWRRAVGAVTRGGSARGGADGFFADASSFFACARPPRVGEEGVEAVHASAAAAAFPGASLLLALLLRCWEICARGVGVAAFFHAVRLQAHDRGRRSRRRRVCLTPVPPPLPPEPPRPSSPIRTRHGTDSHSRDLCSSKSCMNPATASFDAPARTAPTHGSVAGLRACARRSRVASIKHAVEMKVVADTVAVLQMKAPPQRKARPDYKALVSTRSPCRRAGAQPQLAADARGERDGGDAVVADPSRLIAAAMPVTAATPPRPMVCCLRNVREPAAARPDQPTLRGPRERRRSASGGSRRRRRRRGCRGGTVAHSDWSCRAELDGKVRFAPGAEEYRAAEAREASIVRGAAGRAAASGRRHRSRASRQRQSLLRQSRCQPPRVHRRRSCRAADERASRRGVGAARRARALPSTRARAPRTRERPRSSPPRRTRGSA